MRWYWQRYLSTAADRANPLACPLRAPDLRELPPAIVVTAEFDPLRDEGERYADQLDQAGVSVVRRRYGGTIHGFLWMATALDEYQQLLTDLHTDVSNFVPQTTR
jgi:acetyl esterase